MDVNEVTVWFHSNGGAEGWEEALAKKALEADAIVLRRPDERGIVVPEEIADGTFILLVGAAARQVIMLIVFLLDRLRVGVVIDCRPKTPVITRNSGLRRGEALLIDDQSSRLFRTEASGFAEADAAAILQKLSPQPQEHSGPS